MKTPEEIKKGLEYCYSAKPCADCKYDERDFPHCVRRLLKDAIDGYEQLESRLAQAERERDAAVVDMRSMAVGYICNLCARTDEGYIPMPPHCKYADGGDCFRWRGVCPENTKEAAST